MQEVPQDAAVLIVTATEKDYFPQGSTRWRATCDAEGAFLSPEPRQADKLVGFLKDWGAVAARRASSIANPAVRGSDLGLEPVVSDYGDHPAVKSLKGGRCSLSRARSPGDPPPKASS